MFDVSEGTLSRLQRKIKFSVAKIFRRVFKKLWYVMTPKASSLVTIEKRSYMKLSEPVWF